MAVQKLYAGAKLREMRARTGLTQRAFAERLGISLPYLNQIENNNRPVSTAVLLALGRGFGFDVAELQAGDEVRLLGDLREALADPVFAGAAPPLSDLRLAAASAPALARALLDLHAAYRQAHERLASLDEALGREDARLRPSPWEEVRDFFHYCDNYIDAVDRAAERFASRAGRDAQRRTQEAAAANLPAPALGQVSGQTSGRAAGQGQGQASGQASGRAPDAPGAAVPAPADASGGGAAAAAEAALADRGIAIRLADTAAIRDYDPQARVLTLSARAARSTRTFQMLLQVALLTQDRLLEATLDLARFRTPEARDIAKVGLANYFAGAALMPYGAFLAAAQETRHDLERLARRFGASLEQVAHRLSTLQRPGAKGIPFFFVRVDPAGTITKRHSATMLQFARYGGACPLWNVHRAFETPGRFLRQLAETPDGVRYFCLARDVSKPGGAFDAPVRRHAIGLGCEVRHAGAIVYADHMDTGAPAAFEPIGISCRICDRRDCHQRAVPPLERRLRVDPHHRDVLPYRVE